MHMCCCAVAAFQEQSKNAITKAGHKTGDGAENAGDNIKQALGIHAPLPDKYNRTKHKAEVSTGRNSRGRPETQSGDA